MNYTKLEKKAKKLRQDTFLAFIQKGEAHLGGSFSMIEILISLFDVIMNISQAKQQRTQSTCITQQDHTDRIGQSMLGIEIDQNWATK